MYFDEEKELFLQIINEKPNISKEVLLDRLKLIVANEMDKSDEDKDCDFILECIDYINQIEGKEKEESDIEEKVENIISAAKFKKHGNVPTTSPLFLRTALAIGGAFIILLVINSIFNLTTGDNIFYRNKSPISRSSVASTIGENTANNLYTTLTDECKLFGLTPILPSNIPNDFMQKQFEITVENGNKILNITLENGSDILAISAEYYIDKNEIPPQEEPSYAGPDLTIKGTKVYLTEKNNQYVTSFNYGNYSYSINSTLNFNQTKEILESIR